MATAKPGLFSYKRQYALRHHEASLFGPKFNVWVLERWKFTPLITPSGLSSNYSLLSPLDYSNSGSIDAVELENFLRRKGKFDLDMQPNGDKFEGRLRLLFSTRKNATEPPFSMNPKEFELIEKQLDLHPSTVQYARRAMKASKFWSADDIVLSFPPVPVVRIDSISLSYDVQSRFTNALIGENSSVEDGEDETIYHNTFKAMLDHCRAYWAHPLLVPVLLIDLLMTSLEAQIVMNISSIESYEHDISNLASLDKNAKPLSERQNITQLLTDLHHTLKGAIKLLDAANWMQRTAKLLIEVGDNKNLQTPTGWMETEWAQMKGFLEDVVQITENLVPDPKMTQQRCQSQIDILNSQIAQEDNLLAARVAVSATRDSSAMKALAVITALFLPGTYIATLFGMSMFDWQGASHSTADSNSTAGAASGNTPSQSAVVMPYIWIYAAVSVVLTIAVVFGWRVWWVRQDRDFRIKLPKTVRSIALDKNPSSVDNGLATSFWEEVFMGDMKRASRKKSSV